MTETIPADSAATAPGLHARVARSVDEHGFEEAWRRHFPELVRAHHAGQLPHPPGRLLLDWMARDPATRPHVEALPAAVAEAAPQPRRWESMLHRDYLAALRELYREHARGHPEVREGDGTPVKFVLDTVFENWGRTVRNTPAITFIPHTIAGVQAIVAWSKAQGMRVRAAGYRHTWGDLYSADRQVLVSMLPLDVVDDLPAMEPGIDPANQLQGIRVTGTVVEDGVEKALCRIGAATTNEQFRRWCLSDAGGAWKWTVPLNVIMVEITWGGSNAPICHGAGLRHRTLSDLVAEVEYVDVNGALTTVSDPELLRAASGCFGLLGIVTAVTLRLDPMSYAVMQPVKPPLALTIPPPAGFPVPPQVDLSGVTPATSKAAWDEFVRRCENDYYAEWFWFPYQADTWVNTWNNDGKREDARDYPSPAETFLEEAEEFLAQLLNDSVFRRLPGEWQAKLLAGGAMVALPAGETIVTPVIDALHFRRGIQNMRVWDMELEIPIPPLAGDPARADWSVCQKAWWDAISLVYSTPGAPMRITLEMRVMGGSGVTMAPQHGNQWGTCSIEVLTAPNVDAGEWLAFRQAVADRWMALTGPAGEPLNTRTHWAKQWEGLTFAGKPAVEYLRDVAYRDRIPEFRAALQQVASAGGYTLQDLRLFSNPLLDELFEAVFAE